MTLHLGASVGAAGANRRPDVDTLQRLLAQRGLYRGRLDGLCGPLTVQGILHFQRGFLGKPDGRVDPNGLTWRHLVGHGSAASSSASSSSASAAHGRPAAPAVRPAGVGARTAASSSSSSSASAAAATRAPVATASRASATAPSHAGAASSSSSSSSSSSAAARAVPANQTLTTTVPRPPRDAINHGLVAVSGAYMLQRLGAPRAHYTQDCLPMTNEKLKKHVVTRSMGRFNVTGLDVAVESLQRALEQVRTEQPELHAALGTAGMLCCRLQRGSTTAVSNHSWGTAIDFTLNHVLDRRGDDRVQIGLTLLAPIMNQHGWYWGAAFRTEDAMHFEASRSLIEQWAPRLL